MFLFLLSFIQCHMGHAVASTSTRFLIVFLSLQQHNSHSAALSLTSCWCKFSVFPLLWTVFSGSAFKGMYNTSAVETDMPRCGDSVACVSASGPKMDSQRNCWTYPASRMPDSLTLSMPATSGNTSMVEWTSDSSLRTTHYNTRGVGSGEQRDRWGGHGIPQLM